METPSRLTANQRLQIAVKITELQAGQPKDRVNNPFPRSKYIQVVTDVLGRSLPNNTMRRILDDLGIEPRGVRKPAKRKEFTSIRTQNVAEIKERLDQMAARLVQVVEKIDSIKSHLPLIDQRIMKLIPAMQQLLREEGKL